MSSVRQYNFYGMSYKSCLYFRGTPDWALCSKVNYEVRMVRGSCTCLNLPTSRVLLFRPVLLQPLSRLSGLPIHGCCIKRSNVQRVERPANQNIFFCHLTKFGPINKMLILVNYAYKVKSVLNKYSVRSMKWRHFFTWKLIVLFDCWLDLIFGRLIFLFVGRFDRLGRHPIHVLYNMYS